MFSYLGKGKNHLLKSTLVKGDILVLAKCTSSTLPETNIDIAPENGGPLEEEIPALETHHF